MSITKQNYFLNIKPEIDKIYEFLKPKDGDSEDIKIDRSLVADLLLDIVQNETNFEKLLKIIQNASPLQTRICENNGIRLVFLEAKLKE